MKVLVLGGSFFFGKKIVFNLLELGHEVTVITRGNNKLETNSVEHIVCDCTDEESLNKAVEGRNWDMAIHQICFDQHTAEVFSNVFHDRVNKVIVTSTILVYEGLNCIEDDFNETLHRISSRESKGYAEKKRDVEHIISSRFPNCYILPRLPVVIGLDDYTNRLSDYVDMIRKGIAVGSKNSDVPFNLITSDIAADMLVSIIDSKFVGSINLAQEGQLSVQWITRYISSTSSLKVYFEKDKSSPLIFDNMVSIKTDRLSSLIHKKYPTIYQSTSSLLDLYLNELNLV